MRKNKWLRVLITAAVATAVLGAGLWLSPQKQKTSLPAKPAPTGASATDPAHEKLFLEEELRRKPAHSPVLLRLAQIERGAGNLADARKHLEQAVAGDQKMADARLELSSVYYQLGDIPAAMEQNRAILRDDPRQSDALYNLGAIAANQGRIAEARKYWSEAIASGPETPGAKKAAESQARLEPGVTR